MPSIKAIKDLLATKQVSKKLYDFLPSSASEIKNYNEITTPYCLRSDMIETIPDEFWKSPKKVFDPCCGKGAFVLDVLDKFMEHLPIEDTNERYRVIVEECLYFSDINEDNIETCKLILDIDKEYHLNSYVGDTLQLDTKVHWKVFCFDLVLGNPPYNLNSNRATGNTIWYKFTKAGLNWLNQDGYLLFVHPAGWRKANDERCKYYGLFELMAHDNYMIHLSIHGIKDGMKVFNAGTRYDWYLIRKGASGLTMVEDEMGQRYNLDLKQWKWLPNYRILDFKKFLAKENEENCVIHNKGIDPRNSVYASFDKDKYFKYTVIHTIPKSGKRYFYSSVNKGFGFGVPKLVISTNGLNDFTIDLEGQYGYSKDTIVFGIKDLEEAQGLGRCLMNPEFKALMKACIVGLYAIDRRMFKLFKRDFWKHYS